MSENYLSSFISQTKSTAFSMSIKRQYNFILCKSSVGEYSEKEYDLKYYDYYKDLLGSSKRVELYQHICLIFY